VLVSSAGGKAIIAQHVPQGANRGSNTNFDAIYETTMTSIVQQYASTIIVVMCGHLHRDYFRMYYAQNGNPPLIGRTVVLPYRIMINIILTSTILTVCGLWSTLSVKLTLHMVELLMQTQ